MVDPVHLSVDGESGVVVGRGVAAQVHGRRHPEDWAVALIGDSIDGRPGENASEPTPGAPGGVIVVELSESTDTEGAIQASIVEHVSTNQPPASTLVLPGRNLTLTARGGEGEAGHDGGDGQSGMAGVSGLNATRETDATVGTTGGNGGNAGAGTNGANGGDGGTIHVQVDSNMTHLLLSVDWDVGGGAGGPPGHHGKPGKGGLGGPGGEGHRWFWVSPSPLTDFANIETERVGWRYDCTENCITTGGTTADRRLATTTGFSTRTMSLVAPMRTQMVQGGNIQAMIAEVARRYGAFTHQQAPGLGTCRCSGGSGHCVGCKPTPIHKTFQRARADDGRSGRDGEAITTPLLPGSSGKEGSATIVVRYPDGSHGEHRSCYQLELVEFDIEDENGDGIFEPGEHLFVRRMRIRNTGGMPSPTCQIPITIQPSKWFSPVEDSQGLIYLPPSIPAGESVTMETSMKIFINSDFEPSPSGTSFSEKGVLSVIATMPWLNKPLEHFEFSRVVHIQYPLELRNFRYLATMAQGSQNKLSWEIYNKSTKEYGESATLGRCIEMDVSFPTAFGSLLLSTGAWDEKAMGNVEAVKPNESTSIEQVVRVSRDAQNYAYADLRLDLYISLPDDGTAQREYENPPELQLIQQHELRVQIAAHHIHNESAGVLLVTNSATTNERVSAIRSFIEDDLKMEADEWNIGLYGGLQYQVEEGESAPSNVLTTYEGKTIIFLGNGFEFFQSGTRTVFQLCDLEPLIEASLKGTSFLFLSSSPEVAQPDWFHHLVFPMLQSHDEIPTTGSTAFDTVKEMATSISQNKGLGNSSVTVLTANVNSKWHRFGFNNGSTPEAKRVAKYLRRSFPQERFLVSALPPSSNHISPISDKPEGPHGFMNKQKSPNKDLGRVAVLQGLPRSASLIVGEAQQIQWAHQNQHGTSQSAQNGPGHPPILGKPSLDRYEAYLCIAALPKARRMEILWSLEDSRENSLGPGPTICRFEAAANSLLLDINTEINKFLSRAPWPNSMHLTGSQTSNDSTLQLHFPTLAVLLTHETSRTPAAPPENVLTILRYSLASTFPQKKRHVVKSVVVPFGHRRSHLRKYLTSLFNEFLTRKGYGLEDLKAFHKTAKTLHSSFNGQKRNTSRLITRTVAEFTRKSDHAFKTGQVSTRDVVPGTKTCDAAEWNWRYRDMERRKMEIEMDRARAMEARGKLIVVPGVESESEFPEIGVREAEIDGSPVAQLA